MLAAAQTLEDRVAQVSTAEELGQALEDGAKHIEIVAHLNLTTINQTALTSDGQVFPSVFLAGNMTIRGNCSTAPDDSAAPSPVSTYVAGRCVIFSRRSALHFATEVNALVSNLVFKSVREAAQTPFALIQIVSSDVKLWLEDVSFEGSNATFDVAADGEVNNAARNTGIDVLQGSSMHCNRCVFRDLWSPTGGSAITIGSQGAGSVRPLSAAALTNTSIGGLPAAREDDPGQLSVTTGFIFFAGPGLARLEDSVFEDLSLERPFVVNNGNSNVSIYTDFSTQLPVVARDAAVSRVTFPIASVPAAASARFLSLQDPERLALSQAYAAALTNGPAVQVTVPDEDASSDGGLSTGTIAGIVVAVAAAALAALVAALVFWRRRRHHRKALVKTSSPAAATPVEPRRSDATYDAYNAYNMAQPAVRNSGATGSGRRNGRSYSVNTTTATGLTADIDFLCGDVSGIARDGLQGTPLEELEHVLDRMHEADELFVSHEGDAYRVLNFLQRRAGGQGCVQFVKKVPELTEYAVKFFFHGDGAFARELDLYRNPALASILPQVKHIEENTTRAVVTQSGYAFPPFIMVEKGESLNEWASRVAPDFMTALFVLMHIAERLTHLHAAGMCHRDVKPANILWRPMSNSWTLIDFGCAASIGEDSELLFSLPYAPPEVLRASMERRGSIVADGAVDIWALGIIAFELFTKTRVFVPFDSGADEVMEQLSGAKPLPWEGPRRKELLPKLKVLQRSVLACLSRDPAARPTAAALLGRWNSLFEEETGTTRDEFQP